MLVYSRKSTPQQIEEFLIEWRRPCPVVVVPTTYHDWHLDDMNQAGVSRCIYANHGLRATLTGVRRTLETHPGHQHESEIEAEVCSVREIFDLQRVDEWLALGR